MAEAVAVLVCPERHVTIWPNDVTPHPEECLSPRGQGEYCGLSTERTRVLYGVEDPIRDFIIDTIRRVLHGLSHEDQWSVLDEVMGTAHHIVEVRGGSWTIQHALACREDLISCEYNRWMESQNPHGDGRYRLIRRKDGAMSMEQIA